MRSLIELISSGIAASELPPAVANTVFYWTSDNWCESMHKVSQGRAPGWKLIARARHDQLQRLAPINVPLAVSDELLLPESNDVLLKMHADIILMKELKKVADYDPNHGSDHES